MTNESTQIDGVSRRTVLKATPVAVGGLSMSGVAAANGRGVINQTEDVFGQGPGGSVVAEDGATLRRTRNGISMRLSMPTPEPGTYTYPSGPEGGAWTDEEGPPEVFTLWCFVFDPDLPPFNPPDAEWTGGVQSRGTRGWRTEPHVERACIDEC